MSHCAGETIQSAWHHMRDAPKWTKNSTYMYAVSTSTNIMSIAQSISFFWADTMFFITNNR